MQYAFYLHSVGKSGSPVLKNIYSDYIELFSIHTITSLRQVITADANMNKRLRYLIEFISVEYVNNSTLLLKQKLHDLKSQKIQLPDGNKLSYNELRQKLFWAAGKEKDELEDVLKQFTEKELNMLLRQNFQGELKAINQLGCKCHSEMFHHLTGIDPAAWSNAAAKFLEDTSKVYFKELFDYKEKNGGGKDKDISRNDLFKSFWENSNDDCFGSISPLEILNTLKKRGLNEIQACNIKIESSNHFSRAFCSVLNVPDDIRIVIGQGSGFDNIRDLLHEAGHALHYASEEGSLPFEFQRIGDDSVTESYAALIENLVYDPYWLESEIHFNKIQKSELISFLKFYKLTKLRSIALKVLYDFDLYSGLPEEILKANYRLYHKRHLGVEVNEFEFLSGSEPFLFSLRYFRAQLLAFNLRRKLETSFGSKWFENREAFKELNGLWSTGQQFSPEEISETFCSQKLIEANLSSEFK